MSVSEISLSFTSAFYSHPKQCLYCKLLPKNLFWVKIINNCPHLLFLLFWKQQKYYYRDVKFPEYILLNENQINPEWINHERCNAHCAQRNLLSPTLKGALLTNYAVIIRTCWSQGLMTRRVWLLLYPPWPIRSQQDPSYSSSENCIVFIGILNCIWDRASRFMDSFILLANVGIASVYSRGNECHLYHINWEWSLNFLFTC